MYGRDAAWAFGLSVSVRPKLPLFIRKVKNNGDHSLGNGATQLPASGNLPLAGWYSVVC